MVKNIYIYCLYFILSMSASMAQAIEGKYDYILKKFVIKEILYTKSLFSVRECLDGNCIVLSNTLGFGIIDSTGHFIIQPAAQEIEIWNHRYSYFNIKDKDYMTLYTPNIRKLVSTKYKEIVYTYSDTSGDCFFVKTKPKTSLRDNIEIGEFYRTNASSSQLVQSEKPYMVNQLRYSHIDYFIGGLLITPLPDKSYLFRNYRFDTLYKEYKIIDFVNTKPIQPIYINVENQFCFVYNPEHKYQYNCFSTYQKRLYGSPSLVYKIGSKSGGIIYPNPVGIYNYSTQAYEVFPKRIIEFPPVFDSLYIAENNAEVTAIIGDTMWTYNQKSYTDTFEYKKDFSEAWKLKNDIKVRQIGYQGQYIGKSKKDYEYLVPNTFFFGSNFHSYEFVNAKTKDSSFFNTLNFEAGAGWYEADEDISFLYGSWSYYGWGASLEYKALFRSSSVISEQTNEKFHPLYFNLRAEGGIGGYFLIFPLSIQVQGGYTTDFRNHFLRLGAGVSILNLQLGAEILIQLNRSPSTIYNASGLYARYHFFSY
ncbi:MAG: hypothetical protein HYZ42_14705 [Bacteroidetes bacterium]|nr:hypothetical protein [Bacteroidota bacterium]